MDISPLFPEPQAARTLSQGTRGWRDSNIHPLLTTQGLVRMRTQLSIGDWLLTGSCLQALILLFKPRSVPVFWVLMPTFSLVAFKLTRLVLTCCGWLENRHMKDVALGSQTAIFPEPDGGLVRPVGKTIGGGKIVVFLLTTKCNHPLGMFHPTFRLFSSYGRDMIKALEKNASEFGLLGYSDYNSNFTTTHPVHLSIMYFKSLEHLHHFAHSSVHRAGWDWWVKAAAEGKVDEITIGHELYEVDEGKWENTKHNAPAFDFAATSHAIKTPGGEKKWMCPIMDASKGYTTSARRMGIVKA